MSSLDLDSVKTALAGKSPDYIRGYLEALKRGGDLTDHDGMDILNWATEAAMRRMISGPVGD